MVEQWDDDAEAVSGEYEMNVGTFVSKEDMGYLVGEYQRIYEVQLEEQLKNSGSPEFYFKGVCDGLEKALFRIGVSNDVLAENRRLVWDKVYGQKEEAIL